MLALPTLNRRHKAGLFLALVAAGLSLFFEASAKQTAGIVLLGLAATWFFGSLRARTLGIITASTACCVGFYLMGAPVSKDRELYRSHALAYNQALSDIREAAGKITVAPDQVTAWDENGNPVQRKNWPIELRQLLDDKGFLTVSRDQQIGYLSYVSSDFRKASAEDQRDYLDYLLALARLAKNPLLPTDVKQPLVLEDLSKDPDFQGLPLIEKKKVLLTIGGDEIAFESPTTGKWKSLPIKQWDEALNAGYRPFVPKKWFTENSPRSVQIPASAIRWLRPDKKGSEWDAYTINFPPKMTQVEILRSFERNMLMTRPTFSLGASMRSHLLSSVSGSLLLFVGLVSLILFVSRLFAGERRKLVSKV